MFTRQQIEEIRRGLALYSKKDTQFDKASYPISGNEEMSFVQNGKNVRMNLRDFLDNLLLLRASDFVNLSDIYSSKYTLEEAIKAVPLNNRRVGLVITYIDSNTNEWVIYQFTGQHSGDWTVIEYWENILGNAGGFKGYFNSECLLESMYPSPKIGEYAFVGTTLKDSVVYRCVNNGVWSSTSESATDYIAIVVGGNITIGPNGNWFQDGVDTGFKAEGVKGDDGKTPVLRVSEGYLQYNYGDSSEWTNLISIPEILSYMMGKGSERPTLTPTDEGYMFYDTTLKKYIVWNGTSWTNMDGTNLT